MDTNTIIAFATIAYVAVTLALLLEARASRIAATDVAEVSARLHLHRDYESDPLLYLENHGPAVARDIALSLAFLAPTGQPTPPERRVVNAVMAPRTHLPYMPSVLLERKDSGELPSLKDLAAARWSLHIKWSWKDQRRLLAIGPHRTHHRALEVSLEDYFAAVHGGPLIFEPDLYSAIAKIARHMEEGAQTERMRRSQDESEAPAEIQASIDVDRFARQVRLWRARISEAVRRLRE